MVILCVWNWETVPCALEHANRWSVKAGQLRFKMRHNAILTLFVQIQVLENGEVCMWRWKGERAPAGRLLYLPTIVTGRWRRGLSWVSYKHHLIWSNPCIALATICLHQHVGTVKCKLSVNTALLHVVVVVAAAVRCRCCLTAISFMSFSLCYVLINCFYVL